MAFKKYDYGKIESEWINSKESIFRVFCENNNYNYQSLRRKIKHQKKAKLTAKIQDKKLKAIEKGIIKQAEKEGFNLGKEIASAQKRHLKLSRKLEKLIDINLQKADGILTDHFALESYIRMLQKLSNSTKTIAEYIKQDNDQTDKEVTIKFDIPENKTKK